jgi:hypothetical protein
MQISNKHGQQLIKYSCCGKENHEKSAIDPIEFLLFLFIMIKENHGLGQSSVYTTIQGMLPIILLSYQFKEKPKKI